MMFDFDWCLELYEQPEDIAKHFPFEDCEISTEPHSCDRIVRVVIDAKTDHAALLVKQTLESEGYDAHDVM